MGIIYVRTIKKGEEQVDADIAVGDDGSIVLSNAELETDAEYMLEISGVKTEAGNAVTYTTTFKTEAKNLANVVITDSEGSEVNELSAIKTATQGELFVTGTIVNDTDEEKDVYVISATFENDRIENIIINPIKIAANSTRELTKSDEIFVNIPEKADGTYQVKAFVWSGDEHLKPLCDALIIE